MKLGPYELGPNDENQGIYTGDARELAKAIPDESVDLIFTDPIYDRIDDYRWLAETAARVLKDSRWMMASFGIGYLPATVAALSGWLDYEWQHIGYMPTLNARGAYRTFSNYRAFLRYKKGSARPTKDARDLYVDGFDARNSVHGWAKNMGVVARWLRAYSENGALVLDPFTGGGTIPAVCKQLGRHWLAFEIEPETAEAARERVRQTQPPLFVPEPQQAELEFVGRGDGHPG